MNEVLQKILDRHVFGFEAVVTALAEDEWEIIIRRHPDESGPRCEPADPKHPRVYSVTLSRFHPITDALIYGRGRQPDRCASLLEAVADAAKGWQESKTP